VAFKALGSLRVVRSLLVSQEFHIVVMRALQLMANRLNGKIKVLDDFILPSAARVIESPFAPSGCEYLPWPLAPGGSSCVTLRKNDNMMRRSLREKLCVRSRSDENEHERHLVSLIDEQPIGRHVTLAKSREIAAEAVVLLLRC
jgi:hypothetical protein